MKRIEELENILENNCDGSCKNCKYRKQCAEYEILKNSHVTTFCEGETYTNEETNIFIKNITGNNVAFIEGFSPSAIHDIQNLTSDELSDYMRKWGFKYSGDFE